MHQDGDVKILKEDYIYNCTHFSLTLHKLSHENWTKFILTARRGGWVLFYVVAINQKTQLELCFGFHNGIRELNLRHRLLFLGGWGWQGGFLLELFFFLTDINANERGLPGRRRFLQINAILLTVAAT